MAGDREPLLGSMERTRTQDQDGDQGTDVDPDQERLAHLRAFGIFWESLKLCYWRKPRYFFAILFTLGVPFLLQLTLSSIFYLNFPYYASSLFPPPPPQPHPQPATPPAPATAASASATGHYVPIQDSIWRTLYVGRDFQTVPDFEWPFLIIWGVQILIPIVNQVCRALWVAGTTYTVGLSYSRRWSLSFDDLSGSRNKSAVSSFIGDVLRRAPRLWYRLMRTWLWQVLLLAIPFFILLFSLVAILSFSWPIWLQSISLSFFIVCAVAIHVVTDVAEAATVLDPEESCYGSEAFKKGMALLKDKRRVAVGVYSIWLVVFLVPGVFFFPVPLTTVPNPDVDPWDPVRILRIVIYCIFQWVVTQSYQASSGVLYTSLKAYHGERIAGMSLVEQTPSNQTPASLGKDDGWV